ncbi:MAG: YbaK/EbsC family protein [Candidatus Rokubacteria bacterium]|nr:YbaK/EbsC family protein [Candidatus Rokubacteria bacterium]
MKPAAERVQAALAALGLDRQIIELGVDARTSAQAAAAVGIGVGRIAKSLVFTAGGNPILVIASGENRVDESKLAVLAGGRIQRADADTVRAATGYAIGGVPPIAHQSAMPIFVDRDLLRYELIYAAGGVPECVFPLTPDELMRITAGTVADVKVDRRGESGASGAPSAGAS